MANAWQDLITAAMNAGVITREQRLTLHGLKHRGITDTKGKKAEKKEASGHKTDAMLDPANNIDPFGESGFAAWIRPTHTIEPVIRVAPEPIPPTTIAQGVRNAAANAANRPPKIDPERIGPAPGETAQAYQQRVQRKADNYRPRTEQPERPQQQPQPGLVELIAEGLEVIFGSKPRVVPIIDPTDSSDPKGNVTVGEVPAQEPPEAPAPEQPPELCQPEFIVPGCVT